MNRAAMANTGQLATIHMLAQRAGMDDDTYRDFLRREIGVGSARDATVAQAGLIIDKLRPLAGDARTPGAVAGLDTPVGRKLRALWIAGHDLGVVHSRTDQAMLAFLNRQTGVSHTRFLREPGAGNKAIEGLKAWLARSAKLEWPADTSDVIASKRAVVDAQWANLIAIGDVRPLVAHKPMDDLDQYAFRIVKLQGWCFFEAGHYDQVQAALGRRLRGAIARKQKPADSQRA